MALSLEPLRSELTPTSRPPRLHRSEHADTFASSVIKVRGPAQYFALGFKDRNLEEKYLNFVATRGKGRNLLGLSAAFILVFLL